MHTHTHTHTHTSIHTFLYTLVYILWTPSRYYIIIPGGDNFIIDLDYRSGDHREPIVGLLMLFLLGIVHAQLVIAQCVRSLKPQKAYYIPGACVAVFAVFARLNVHRKVLGLLASLPTLHTNLSFRHLSKDPRAFCGHGLA